MILVRQSPDVRTTAQRAGDLAEARVAERLERLGWRLVGRQVRAGRGELDLVAIDPGPPIELVIVEVRWRARRDFGLPEETLDWRKRAHLRTAIGRLREAGRVGEAPLAGLPIRVDLVVVEPAAIRHHRAVEL